MLAQVNHKQVKAEEVKCRLFFGIFGFKESNTQIAISGIQIKGKNIPMLRFTTTICTCVNHQRKMSKARPLPK